MLAFTFFPMLINFIVFDTKESVYYMYGISCVLFIAFYLLVEFCIKGKRQVFPVLNYELGLNKIYYSFCLFMSLIGFSISLYIILFDGVLKPGDLFYLLRYRHTYLNLSTYGSEYFSIFSLSLGIFEIIRKNYKLSLLFISMHSTYALSVGQRTSLLFILTIVIYFLVCQRKLTPRLLFYFIVSFFTVIVLIAISSNKLGSVDNNFILEYFSYGLTSFSDTVFEKSPIDCLSIVLGSLSKLFFLQECTLPIYLDRGEFNVFTYMFQPFMYMGEFGVYLVSSVLGLVYGVVFSFRNNFILINIFCGLIIYPLVMIFYDFQFNLITPFYVILVFAPLLINKTNGSYMFRFK